MKIWTRNLAFWLLALIFLTINATAAVFYVDVNSTNPTLPYADWSTASTDIQGAIDAANPGDQILVTNGIYQTGGRVVYGSLTNRVVINKAVTVQSVNGPTATIIQGNSVIGSTAVRCVYMTNSSTLSGFTVTNGGTLNTGDQYQEMSGGGIWATNNTDAIVTNCVLTGNVAYQLGGGAYSGNIISSMIVQNSAYQGGGMANSAATNSLIVSNSASTYGGGVASATLKNCKVMSNLASFGGGAYSSLLYGCLMVGNQASMLGGAIYNGQSTVSCTIVGNSSQQGAGGINGNAGSVVNNIIYSNMVAIGSTPNYSGISIMNNCCTLPLFAASGMSGGNITNDPGFVDFANGDLHLRTNSPCINSGGSPGPISSDLDGNPRLVDGFADIGAYENQNSVFVLPYLFAQQYVLPLDGSVDSDGDGMNNWQEAIASTNPTNAASVLKILSVSNSVSGATVKWQSVISKKYYLQRSTNLSVQPSFSSIQSNLSTFGTTVSFKDTTATNDGPYFYRVGVQ